jgi:phosphoglycolate phosphatase
MIDTFIFDLDGTLVTMEFDVPRLRREISEIFRRYGIQDYIFRAPLLESLAEVASELTEKKVDPAPMKKEVLELIRMREEEGSERTSPIRGAKEFLSFLKKKGYHIAVITRTNRKSAQHSLERCGIAMYIDLLLSRDDVLNLKPHPSHILEAIGLLGKDPSCCVMVGDHAMDVEVGRKVGCITVGVLSGSGTHEALKEADYVVKTVSEIRNVLVL